MNLVLAIDTSGGTQVALVPDGVPAVVLMRPDPRGHAEYTSVMIERVMRQAGRRISELTAVAVGTGPAPFTGLRVGLVTARTVARAAGVPLYGVASTEAWAGSAFAAAPQLTQVRVVTDARRREVYTARYDRSDQAPGLVEVEEPQVLKPADLAPTLQADRAAGIAIVGPGVYSDVLGETAPIEFDPAVLARIALAKAAIGADVDTEPRYLRRPDIHGVAGGAA